MENKQQNKKPKLTKKERQAKALAKKGNKQQPEKTSKVKKVVEPKEPEPIPLRRVYSVQCGEMAEWIRTGKHNIEHGKIFYAANEMQPLFDTLSEYRNNVVQPITQRESFARGLQREKSQLMDEMMGEFTFWQQHVSRREEYKKLERRWCECVTLISKTEYELKLAYEHMLRVSCEMQNHYYNL